jgi:ribosomal protein L37AE/L43A
MNHKGTIRPSVSDAKATYRRGVFCIRCDGERLHKLTGLHLWTCQQCGAAFYQNVWAETLEPPAYLEGELTCQDSMNPEIAPDVTGPDTALPVKEVDFAQLAVTGPSKTKPIVQAAKDKTPAHPATATGIAPIVTGPAKPKTRSRTIASRNRAMRQASFL